MERLFLKDIFEGNLVWCCMLWEAMKRKASSLSKCEEEVMAYFLQETPKDHVLEPKAKLFVHLASALPLFVCFKFATGSEKVA